VLLYSVEPPVHEPPAVIRNADGGPLQKGMLEALKVLRGDITGDSLEAEMDAPLADRGESLVRIKEKSNFVPRGEQYLPDSPTGSQPDPETAKATTTPPARPMPGKGSRTTLSARKTGKKPIRAEEVIRQIYARQILERADEILRNWGPARFNLFESMFRPICELIDRLPGDPFTYFMHAVHNALAGNNAYMELREEQLEKVRRVMVSAFGSFQQGDKNPYRAIRQLEDKCGLDCLPFEISFDLEDNSLETEE